jgi:hypothetical protein
VYKKALLITALALAMLLLLALPGWADAASESEDQAGVKSPTGLCVLHRPEDAGLRIALTWDCGDGAFGYQVYRSESVEGPFISVGGKSGDSMRDYPVFLDDTVEPGKGYYYAVAGVDADFNESPLSPKVPTQLEPAARTAAGAKRIVCSLSDQRLYFYEGDQLVNITRCSTGLNNRTPAGQFSILGHKRVNVGLGGAVCDYWMSFTSAHGMHAWPRTRSKSYEWGLGAPASHGCIRQHPLEAYWPYNWAPNGTPLTITWSSLSRRIVSGCHDSVGAAELSQDWYFAEGYTGGEFDTYLLLSNPGEDGVSAVTSFLLEGGEVVEHPCWIPPHSRHTISVDQLPGMMDAEFSAHVKADRPIVAERAVYFARGSQTGGTVSAGATQLSNDWYFAEGYTGGEFDTYLLMANPGDEGVSAHVYFMFEGGAQVDYWFWIAPHSRFTLWVDEWPLMDSASFSTHIQADGPIVAERAMYFRKVYIMGGHASVGAVEPSTDWYFAEGCTLSYFDTYLMVGNPGWENAVVNVDYLLSDGSIRYSYLVGPRNRITIPVNSQPGLESRDVSFAVHADHPVVAERTVYYDLDSHRGGHATMGSAQASTQWYFAEGYSDGAFDTFVLLSNPGFADAYVGVGFHREDGATFLHHYLVPAQRRVTVHVDELPGLERAAFSTQIYSDVPIVAERATYFVMSCGY